MGTKRNCPVLKMQMITETYKQSLAL